MTSFLDIDLKGGLNKIKNTVLNRSPIEIKVRDATSNDPWAASGTLKQEVAEATYNYEDSKVVMQTILVRLQDTGKNWRHVYKALQLIEYLVGHGAERIIDECKEHMHSIRSLKNFTYTDEKGRDQGIQVRELSKKVVKLLSDDQAIIEERKLSKKLKDKFVGISADEARFSKRGGGSSSYDDERPSKYDDDKPPKRKTSYDSDEDAAPKKKTPSNEDEDEQPTKKPTPKTPTPQFEEDEPVPETKPAVVKTTRPRKPSVGNNQTPPSKQVAPQPQPKQDSGIFEFDIITSTQPAPQPKPATNFAQVIDPFEVPSAPKVNAAAFKNDFDDGFGEDFEAKWQEGEGDSNQGNTGNDNQTAPSETSDDIDFGGIVDLSLGDKKKQPAKPSSKQPQGASSSSSAPKSLNDLKKEKGGVITPKKVVLPPTSTATHTAIPYTTTAPPMYSTNPFGGPTSAPPNPYGNPYAAPNPYANPYGTAAPPMMMGRGVPPVTNPYTTAPNPYSAQPPMMGGRGAYYPPQSSNNNAFNF